MICEITPTPILRLLLFVADSSPRSATARQQLERLSGSCLGSDDRHGVIDVLQDASQARRWRVALTPAFVVWAGTRRRRFGWVLRDESRIAAAIDELRTGMDVS